MTLPIPDLSLRVCVVVPARDEEALILSCLEALAAQKDIAPEEYEVLLVLDRCEDATEGRAREFARTHPSLRLRFLEGPGRGAGHARRVGMEAACERLHSLGRAEGLISSTDADTVVSPDWLAAQINAVSRGAQAIGGRIELRDADLPEGVSDWRTEQDHLRHLDLLSDLSSDEMNGSNTEHWQFSGASLSLTAAVYKEIGGLEPRAALEDEYLERVLRQRRIPIKRPLDVRVKTSARLVGRASRGLARDLALANWFRRNSFSAGDFTLSGLCSRKSAEISVVVPLEDNHEGALSDGLLTLKESDMVDEIVVVHAGERKVSLPAEVAVHDASVLVPGYGAVRGRGDLLWRALHVARGEIVVFADPSVPDAGSRISGLLGPLIENENLEMARGYSGAASPDALADLLARPLINLYFPELAGFVAPLSREFAARKSLLQTMPFPVGEGVDLSLLLDAARLAGVNALAQSDLGPPPHRIRDRDPSGIAYALLAAAGPRLPGGESAEELAPGPLFVPSPAGLTVRRVAVEERPPLNGDAALAPNSEESAR